MMHCAYRQQRRNGCVFFIYASIRKYYVVYSFVYRFFRFLAQLIQSFFQSRTSFCHLEKSRQFHGVEALVSYVAQYVEFGIRKYRMRQTHHLTVTLAWHKYVGSYRTYIFCKRHNQLFTNRVDGRVCNLGKLLAEVVEQYLRQFTQYSQRSIVAHRCCRFGTVGTHWSDSTLYVFSGKAERTQFAVIVGHRVGNLSSAAQCVQFNTVSRKPLAIRLRRCQLFLQLAIVINLTFLRIYKQNLTRLKSAFLFDGFRLEVNNTGFACHYHDIVLGDKVTCRTQSVTV